jgi:hypothetical protein
MSASNDNSGEHAHPPLRASSEKIADPNAAALERVLEETAAGYLEAEIPTSVLDNLRSVARQHCGSELQVEPMLLQLVEAILRLTFPPALLGSNARSQIVAAVAVTLWEDPASHQRLNTLWQDLQGELV